MSPSFRPFRALIVFLSLLPWFTAARPPLTLTGRVVNEETGEPIPFAGIGITGAPIGTVSNAEGAFLFKLPPPGASDSLLVSGVGFHAFAQTVSSLPPGPVEIRLRPVTVLLEEVLVKGRRITGFEILNEAIAAIPDNYDTVSAGLTAFYRENVRMAGEPVSLIEAVLAVYKAPYTLEKETDRIKLIKGRKITPGQSPYALPEYVNLSNGARSSLVGDPVKQAYRKDGIFNEKNQRHYAYRLHRLGGEKPTYVIEVIPKAQKRKAVVRGTLYIDTETLAFTRVEWWMTPAGIDQENNRQWLKNTLASLVFKLDVNLTAFHQTVTYREVGARWVLSHVERSYGLSLSSKARRLQDVPRQIATSLTVNDIGPKNIRPFAEGDIAASESSMNTLVGDRPDPLFWGHYNIRQAVGIDSVFRKKPPLPAAKPDSGLFDNPFRQGGMIRNDSL